MLQFLQPIWLLGVSGIVVPLVIHLWNNRASRVLKVGSISLVNAQPTPSARTLKLTELLLLLLRCLVITLLSFFLARPFLVGHKVSVRVKGWLLMEPASLKQAYTLFKPTVDSLTKAGFSLHLFQQGFPAAVLETMLKNKDHADVLDTISYWRLIESLEQVLPAETPVQLFTPNRLRNFRGTRPRIAMDVTWRSFTSTDSVVDFTTSAFLSPSDSIWLVKGTSTPSGTAYTRQQFIPLRNADASQTIFESGRLYLAQNKQAGIRERLQVDTSTLLIAIYADQFTQDAKYVQAALEAIRQFAGIKMRVQLIADSSRLKGSWDWVFWLSEGAINPEVKAKNIFRYTAGKPQQTHSWIRTASFGPLEEKVEIYRVVNATKGSGRSEMIWQNAFGEPLLDHQLVKEVDVYQFYTRFDPAWNDLPWASAFPGMLLRLVTGESGVNITSMDNRSIDPSQISPATGDGLVAQPVTDVSQKNLGIICWWAAFVLFFLERIISFVTRKNIANANG